MFPGQGAQTVGMAKDVCAEVPAAKELFDRASSILGYDLLQVCVEGERRRRRWGSELRHALCSC